MGLKTITKVDKLLIKFQNSENSDLNEVLKDKRMLNGRQKSQEFVDKFENFIQTFDPKYSCASRTESNRTADIRG